MNLYDDFDVINIHKLYFTLTEIVALIGNVKINSFASQLLYLAMPASWLASTKSLYLSLVTFVTTLFINTVTYVT